MRRMFVVLIGMVVFPLGAVALDYADATSRYADAPFSQEDAAGISLLTNLGAVRGYPDGTFGPSRPLNRAEYLKIVLLSSPLSANVPVDGQRCFPDTDREDWFSPFVCYALDRGIVRGYPDGYFRPGQFVNYAEALKMLGEIYEYPLDVHGGEQWYVAYARAAEEHGTTLPEEIPPETFLSRGQMARLAAAFRAEHEGELDEYRMAEQGIVQGSSSSSSSSQSSVSSSSSVAPSDFPARSHLLLLGERSLPIADAEFGSAGEDGWLRIVKVEFEEEFDSVGGVFLVDEAGTQITQLHLDVYDQTDRTWRSDMEASGAYILPADEPILFGIEVQLKGRDAGGIPDELVELNRFAVTVEGRTSGQFREYFRDRPFPQHQTVQALITSARSTLPGNGLLQSGAKRLLAAFAFAGTALPDAILAIEELNLSLASKGVSVSNWMLGVQDNPERYTCAVGRYEENTVSCSGIPTESGMLNGTERVFQIYGDVTVNSGIPDVFLQLILQSPGALGDHGAIRWTDGSADYIWVELPEPVAKGTMWGR